MYCLRFRSPTVQGPSLTRSQVYGQARDHRALAPGAVVWRGPVHARRRPYTRHCRLTDLAPQPRCSACRPPVASYGPGLRQLAKGEAVFQRCVVRAGAYERARDRRALLDAPLRGASRSCVSQRQDLMPLGCWQLDALRRAPGPCGCGREAERGGRGLLPAPDA